MPVRPPALDDRTFDDLVEEVLARIPAHTPEWTNPRLGDPGRTIIELFAWLTDTLLYRANLIPERQRLAFLRLLGAQMRAAVPARAIVSVLIDDDKAVAATYLQQGATISGPVNFETLTELTVLPVAGEAYCKRPLKMAESQKLAGVIQGLQDVYEVSKARPYVTTQIFPAGAADLDGFDFVESTVDQSVWIALLAPKKESKEAVKQTLGKNQNGGQQLLNIGIVPSIKIPALFETVSAPAPIPYVCEISTGKEIGNKPQYLTLDVISDTTRGLTRRGVIRVVLPGGDNIGALTNDVRTSFKAGLGDRPPRIDDPEKDARLVCWLRIRPTELLRNLPLSWVSINAVEIDQRQTFRNRIVGQSDGTIDQEVQLPAQAIEPQSLQVQVEETGHGYQPWQQIDDLALAQRDDRVFTLDGEAGSIRFGDGIRGRVPEAGARIRVAFMRAGGGKAGNLPPGALADIRGRDLNNNPVPPPKLKVLQSLATEGGEDAETIAEAERRIPALFRHRNRAVTEEDYKRLAAETPGVQMGRVIVLPRFKPQQRRGGVPGVVSVMVLPFKAAFGAPNPRPDRPFIESVHNYLNVRRTLTTELYVIGCDYVSLSLSAGITIRDGFGRDMVINSVREALRMFLWPLAPGGIEGEGWQLGRAVRERELEVIIARTPGVSGVIGVNLFKSEGGEWLKITASDGINSVEMGLQEWQLPELLSVVVVADKPPLTNLEGAPNPFGDSEGVAVPVVPEVC